MVQSMVQLNPRQRGQLASRSAFLHLLPNSLTTCMSAKNLEAEEPLTRVPSSLPHRPGQHKYHSVDLSTDP
jgi:hypothetical protein